MNLAEMLKAEVYCAQHRHLEWVGAVYCLRRALTVLTGAIALCAALPQ